MKEVFSKSCGGRIEKQLQLRLHNFDQIGSRFIKEWKEKSKAPPELGCQGGDRDKVDALIHSSESDHFLSYFMETDFILQQVWPIGFRCGSQIRQIKLTQMFSLSSTMN